ncbi:YkgB family protein [Sphaerimonospora sp. CA-214678]|uniref:YkgB family protein n=1 Tax=Sphaerimonospora sp. CA-214678 TaxID=3240029 RepID=UPI003D8D419F
MVSQTMWQRSAVASTPMVKHDLMRGVGCCLEVYYIERSTYAVGGDFMERHRIGKIMHSAGISTIRYGLVINFLEIGRIKFEDYEVENIRPLVTSSPPFAWLVGRLGEKKAARLLGVAEIVVGSLIGAKPIAPRASALGSLAAVGVFASTLSFLATTPEAWQETRGEPKLSLTGQFLVKDVVLLGASLLTAADALRAAETRPGTGTGAASW